MKLMRALRIVHGTLPGRRFRTSLIQGAVRLPGAPFWVKAMPYTWLPPVRLRALEHHAAAVTSRAIPGAFVECGVAEGGSALLLALLRTRLDPSRDLWLFDTFEGLPSPTADDPDYDKAMPWTGLCRGELPQIQALMTRHGETNIRYVKGLHQDTMPITPLPPIALLHLDSDWYEPTLTCLSYLWPMVSVGGRVQLDDYGTWAGCHRAVTEYFGADAPVQAIDGGAVWIEKR
jgi:O-methyltransferase